MIVPQLTLCSIRLFYILFLDQEEFAVLFPVSGYPSLFRNIPASLGLVIRIQACRKQEHIFTEKQRRRTCVNIGGVEYNIGDTITIYHVEQTGSMYEYHPPGDTQKILWCVDYVIAAFGKGFIRLQHPAGYYTCMHYTDIIKYRQPPRKTLYDNGTRENDW
jgi:hypothetical protein